MNVITVFTCENDFTAMLSCIYEAGKCKLGYDNFRLCTEPVEEYVFFENYIHVDADDRKATEVERKG